MADLELRYSHIFQAPLDCWLSHYFDLDHFSVIHPNFRARYRIVNVGDRWFETDLRARRGLLLVRNRARFSFLSRQEVEVLNLRGLGRGLTVRDRITPKNGFTRVDRTIRVPGVPRFLHRAIGGLLLRGFLEGSHEDDPLVEGLAEVLDRPPIPYEGRTYPFTPAELSEMRSKVLDPVRVRCDGCQQVRLTYGLGVRGFCLECWFGEKRKAG